MPSSKTQLSDKTRREPVVKAMEKLDNPHLLICNSEFSTHLSDELMQYGSVSDTGAFGLDVIVDDRFNTPVVVEVGTQWD